MFDFLFYFGLVWCGDLYVLCYFFFELDNLRDRIGKFVR